MKKLHFAALLALAGASFAVSSAQAATTTYSSDDLFLGFRQDNNTTADIIIDLGQASQYRDRTISGSLNSIIGTGLGALLASSFGSGWFSDSSVHWGIVGTVGATTISPDLAATLYITSPTGSGIVPVSAVVGTQNTATNDILAMKNAFISNTTSTGLNNGFVQSASLTDSWATHAGNAFADATQFSGFEGTAANTLDLYRVTRSGGANGGLDGLRGTFSIDNTGAVSYSSVPEPTAVSLLGGAGLLFLVRSRKRAVVA